MYISNHKETGIESFPAWGVIYIILCENKVIMIRIIALVGFSTLPLISTPFVSNTVTGRRQAAPPLWLCRKYVIELSPNQSASIVPNQHNRKAMAMCMNLCIIQLNIHSDFCRESDQYCCASFSAQKKLLYIKFWVVDIQEYRYNTLEKEYQFYHSSLLIWIFFEGHHCTLSQCKYNYWH